MELKKGQKVNLVKKGPSLGEILINLNWDRPKKRLFFSPKPIDLDLGCLFEMRDGSRGCVQALGKHFGSLREAPYIALDGDDRTGESEGGENLRVNGARFRLFRRLLVYTFIYEGAASWREANGVVTLRCPGSEDLIVRMDEYSESMKMCAIALLENETGDSFSVSKQVKYFSSHPPMDEAFHWGLRWVAGRK